VIALTRTTGELCSLDPAHIQRIETMPITVVYMTDGARYCVTDTVDEVIAKIQRFRAQVVTTAWRIVETAGRPAAAAGRGTRAPGSRATAAAGRPV
jgi:flagellar protein FlbD